LSLALVGSPELLLLEEPSTALDVKTREAIYGLLLQRKQQGLGILLASHSVADHRMLADKVAVLLNGLIVEIIPPSLLIDPTADEVHPYTYSLCRSFDNDYEVSMPGASQANIGGAPCHYVADCPRAMNDAELGKLCGRESPRMRKVDDSHWCACWAMGRNEPAENGLHPDEDEIQ
jgi:ABC-type dipeptide/oligopeptide/nickel transport system ATPase component